MKKRIFMSLLGILLCGALALGAATLAQVTVGGQAESYKQIYRLLKDRQRYGLSTGAVPRDGIPEMGAVADTAAFSQTNVQEVGVDEADIVKTDGRQIYALSGDKIRVYSARGESLEMLAEISGENLVGMYLQGSRLVVLRSIYAEVSDDMILRGDMVACTAPSGGQTAVTLYDVSNPKSPRQAGEYLQDGRLVSSRMVGGSLYLVTAKDAYGVMELSRPETFIPSVWENGRRTLVPAADISISPDISRETCPDNYLLVGGLDTAGKGEKTAVKALLGYGSLVYASQENLYVSAYADLSKNGRNVSGTRLLRFALKEGKVSLAAQGEIPGTVDDQFSMDEEGAYFRVLTTVDAQDMIAPDGKYSGENEPSQTNSLHVLDLDFNQVGGLSGLAPDERIYSARFMGNMAYFVTFRNVDPLFAVDLSNPKEPQILSALKIPGFSEYLHPFGPGLLLGIGQDADEETGETGNVKLSMFDISNPADVYERQKTLTKEQYSEALYNHKAVLADGERGLIAFPGQDNYLIYTYSGREGFTLKNAIRFGRGEEVGFDNVRGLYIGDYLYAVGYQGIAVIHMDSGQIVNTFYD